MTYDSALLEDLNTIKGTRVLCIGDVILDQFVYGNTERISSEAPIPVFSMTREKHMIGGGGNACANLCALGAEAVFVAVVGDDSWREKINALACAVPGLCAEFVTVPGRPTTLKTRYVSDGQQVLCVARETTQPIPPAAENDIIAFVKKTVATVSSVILSDYGRGLVTPRLAAEVISAARAAGKPVIVDPRGRDFTRYRNATVVTPNRKELETATGIPSDGDDETRAACMKVISTCGISSVLATRGKDGMSLITKDETPLHIPTIAREVFDVSGAGDTVIAVFAAALGAGVSMRNAALLANIAAGIVVGKVGTATVQPAEIAAAIRQTSLSDTTRKSKIVTKEQAAAQADRWRVRGGKVGFTNGTFDLLHAGHISSMRQARAACDYLIVGINSDASVRRYKGPSRPVQDQDTRAMIVSALEMADLVVIFEEDTAISLIEAIRPELYCKGSQYRAEELPEYPTVMSYGGKILLANMEEGMSTTNTIKKMAG